MSGKKKALLVLLMALLLLYGCGAGVRTEGIPAFERMEYRRPDVSEMEHSVAAVKQALAEGKSFRTVTDALDACYEDYYHFLTMYNLAYIRSSRDLTDRRYAEEYAWCDEQLSRIGQLLEEVLYACGTSELAGKLEEDYFWEGFAQEYGDDSRAVYDEEMLAMLQEESVLITHYRTLLANPTIPDGSGEETPFYSHLEQQEGEAYAEALTAFYGKYNEELAGIYIELVQLRMRMAEKLGYDSYEQMAYQYDFERDYTPEQAAAYLEDVKTWLVPLYREADAAGALDDTTGGFLSMVKLRRVLAAGAEQMGGSIRETFAFMDRYGLYDFRVSAHKAAESFQTYLHDYEAPYLFLNAGGNMMDLVNASHEFGHCVDAYVNCDAEETVDVSETFSQAMEYLMPCYLGGVLSAKEQETLYRIKLQDTLMLYVQQCSFAEFEHIVYSSDPEQLSVDGLNSLFLQLTEDYGYYDGVNTEYYAKSWTGIAHFFEAPFYVIAYPVSNDVAMQIYELEQQEPGLGLEKYLEILPREHSGLIDTVTAGGLDSPFAPGRIRKVAEDLRRLLTQETAAAA